ncbi:phage minor head protein [Phocaeicola plebeius]|uniref:phage minor head protein n=1 Tax=Phocaeicola plebeius TaxID=310297 RepID=UPI0030797B5E
MEFPTLEAGWMLLMGWLYQQAGISPESLTTEEVQRFIRTHTDVLDGAVDIALKEVPLDDISVQRLKESNYVFSGIKTFHELNETFPSLLDEEGNRKPFNQFLNDVQKVYDTYNVQYLRTEYNFAQASALMAARWKKFEQDGDRYNLQYRTMYDKRVRRTHRMLHNITLPIESPFWDKYFPPNGWGCRCTVVQVRKEKYPVSDEQEAMNLGSQATAGKYQEMFMFNPGKRMTTFPAYNGYTLRKCNQCDYRPDKMKLAADIPDNEVCRVCRLLQEIKKTEAVKEKKELVKKSRKELERWYKENLPDTTVGKFKAKRFVVKNKNGKEIIINKSFYNDVSSHYQEDEYYLERLEMAKKAHEWIKKATLVRKEKSRHHEDVEMFDVYEYDYNGIIYELKCKPNADGYFLYYMKRK